MLNFDGPSQIFTGTSVDVTVKVQREGNDVFHGGVHVELAPIDGITASPVDIQSDHETGVLTVVVAPPRTHGHIPLSIVGTSPGSTSTGSVVYPVLIRGPAGSVDTGFGTSGIFSLPAASTGTGLVIVNDKIFVGGGIQNDLSVVSLTPDGVLDTAFGTNGIARRSAGALVDTNDLAVLQSGLFLLGGNANGSAVVGGFSPTGAAPAFGTNGVATISLSVGTTLAPTPSVASVTSFLVGGQTNSTNADSAVQIYNDDGTRNNLWPSALGYSNACAGASDTSGCVPRGLTSDTGANLFVCAWKRSGSVLLSSAYDAVAKPTVDTSPYLERCTTVSKSNSGLYVAGDALGVATVIRINGSAVDSTFNPGGARPAAATAPTGSGLTLAKKLIAQADGTFVIASDAQVGGQGVFGVWRLTSTGQTDSDFGLTTGYGTSAIAGTNVTVSAMAIDSEKRIVVAGSNGHMVVTRFWQ